MDLRRAFDDVGDFLDGEEMTGRQAAIVMAIWMGFTAAFGIVVFVVVFVMMGY